MGRALNARVTRGWGAERTPATAVGMLAWLIAGLVRALAWTWRVERPAWPVEGACVAAFLHGEQLPMIALHRCERLTGMASLSKDGALVAAVLTRLGYPVVRGSSSRGGAEALLASLTTLREGGRPALAVDGPRGPAGTVQPGAEALAVRARVPVVCGRITARGWRLRSWDRFLIPYPFARVRVAYAVWRPGQGRLADTLATLADAPATTPR